MGEITAKAKENHFVQDNVPVLNSECLNPRMGSAVFNPFGIHGQAPSSK